MQQTGDTALICLLPCMFSRVLALDPAGGPNVAALWGLEALYGGAKELGWGRLRVRIRTPRFAPPYTRSPPSKRSRFAVRGGIPFDTAIAHPSDVQGGYLGPCAHARPGRPHRDGVAGPFRYLRPGRGPVAGTGGVHPNRPGGTAITRRGSYENMHRQEGAPVGGRHVVCRCEPSRL